MEEMFGDFIYTGTHELRAYIPSGLIFNSQLYNLTISYDYFQKIAQVELHVHSY